MSRARGMTLLEVLIATTILASLTLIVATLWAQTKRWTDETRTHDSALRLQRALTMLDTQWDRRLIDAALADGEVGSATVDASRLVFVTTESVLFPDWPLVRASYIMTETAQAPGDPTGWRLVYEETRLGTTTNAGTDASETDPINLRRSTLVDFTARPEWSAVLSDSQIADWQAAHSQTPAPEPVSGDQRWIGLTDGADRQWVGLDHATNPEAVRLDGTTTEGGFRWALVGRPLR